MLASPSPHGQAARVHRVLAGDQLLAQFQRFLTGDALDAHKSESAGSDSVDLETLRTQLCGVTDMEDYYGLLGVQAHASLDDIKSAYKTASLALHPDKCPGDPKAEERFKALGNGFELLCDKEQRRLYDSNLPFDESTPLRQEFTAFTVELDPEDPQEYAKRLQQHWSRFSQAYGDVFERNAKFSEVRPVPMLGALDDSADTVMRFYQRWLRFRSWRIPTDDEDIRDQLHDLSTARDRYERRYMERENKATLRKCVQQEAARVRAFVEDAMAVDPRVVAVRLQEERDKELQREKRRRDAAMARRVQEEAAEERERVKQEEKEARERELQRAKARGKKLTKLRAKWTEVAAQSSDVSSEVMEAIKTHAPLSWLEVLVRLARRHVAGEQVSLERCVLLHNAPDDTEGFPLDVSSVWASTQPVGRLDDDTIGALFRCVVEQLTGECMRAARELLEEQDRANREEAKRKAARERERVANAQWSVEQLGVLAKAVRRFPSGYRDRWQAITQATNQATGKTCTVKEIREMSKQCSFKRGPTATTPSQPSSTPPPSDTNNDWSAEEQKTFETALKSARGLSGDARWQAVAAKLSGRSAEQCKARFQWCKQQALARRKKAEEQKGASTVSEWTREEQAAFEKALRTHKALRGEERWQKVAASVNGRSAEQCRQRFEYCKQLARARKKK